MIRGIIGRVICMAFGAGLVLVLQDATIIGDTITTIINFIERIQS